MRTQEVSNPDGPFYPDRVKMRVAPKLRFQERLGSEIERFMLKSAKGAVRAPKLARNTPITAADGSSVLRVFLRSTGSSAEFGGASR